MQTFFRILYQIYGHFELSWTRTEVIWDRTVLVEYQQPLQRHDYIRDDSFWSLKLNPLILTLLDTSYREAAPCFQVVKHNLDIKTWKQSS